MRSEEFWNYFNTSIKNKLAARAETLEKIFFYLDQFNRPVGIVETGCVREEGNWAGDGGSTLLFDRYAKEHPGSVVFSVDCDAKATAVCRNLVSDRVRLHTGDSVPYLKALANTSLPELPYLDLLYLDSYDVDFDSPTPSAIHHLKELVAISPIIRPDTLVVVDDSPLTIVGYSDQGKFSLVSKPKIGGKGKYVAEYAEQIGAVSVFSSYQCGWTRFR